MFVFFLAAFFVLDVREFPYSTIYFVENETKERFVIKEVREEFQETLAFEVLASQMAEEVGISCNHVEWLPEVQGTATCHTFVEGELADSCNQWEDLALGQRFRADESREFKKFGPLPQHLKGLSRKVIQSMAEHPDFPPIVALDTFLGNRDRWGNNLFYNQGNDRFVAIDFGESFKSPLVRLAIEQLETMRGEEFSCEEIAALDSFRETLERLLALWPYERIVEFLKFSPKGLEEEHERLPRLLELLALRRGL